MKKRSLVLALVLALALCFAGQAPAAGAVDLEQACSLQVKLGSKGYAEDLDTPADPAEPGEGEPAEGEAPEEEKDDLTGVVLDVYLVSPAEAVAGYDTYTYKTLAAGFEGLELPDLETVDNGAWRAFAFEAAGKALTLTGEGEEAVLPVEPVAKDQELDTKIEGLKPGLYLIVAHGRGMKPAEYITSMTDAEGAEQKGTIALSPNYTYTFQPELVSVPGKESYTDPETGEVTGPNTANPGDWVYEVEVELKPQRESRYGKLVIEKSLEQYELSEPATFVFSVVGVKDGETVYENVVSLTFSSAGLMTAELDRIPVGAEVTVTEVYSGASYKLTGDGTQTAEIALEPATVQFNNTYEWTWNRGHGILNQFSYSKNGEEGSWSWVQDSGGPGAEETGGETA